MINNHAIICEFDSPWVPQISCLVLSLINDSNCNSWQKIQYCEKANRLDIVVKDKKNRTFLLIDLFVQEMQKTVEEEGEGGAHNHCNTWINLK